MGAACTASQKADHEPLEQVIASITRNDHGRSRVDLSCRNLGSKGAREVAAAMCTNTVVKSLFLGWNDIDDTGVQFICDGIRDAVTLSTLILSGNKVTDAGAVHVADLLQKNCSLTYLSLSANQITLNGALVLLQAVELNCSLKTLSLGGNCISAQSIDFVTDTIKHNVTLSSIELGGNNMSPECFAALQHWCKTRQKSCTIPSNPVRPKQQSLNRALSQCTNLSSGPRDDLGNALQWEDEQEEMEDWPVEGASMMAQVSQTEKCCMSELEREATEIPKCCMSELEREATEIPHPVAEESGYYGNSTAATCHSTPGSLSVSNPLSTTETPPPVTSHVLGTLPQTLSLGA